MVPETTLLLKSILHLAIPATLHPLTAFTRYQHYGPTHITQTRPVR